MYIRIDNCELVIVLLGWLRFLVHGIVSIDYLNKCSSSVVYLISMFVVSLMIELFLFDSPLSNETNSLEGCVLYVLLVYLFESELDFDECFYIED